MNSNLTAFFLQLGVINLLRLKACGGFVVQMSVHTMGCRFYHTWANRTNLVIIFLLIGLWVAM